jgi:hypothetical protein
LKTEGARLEGTVRADRELRECAAKRSTRNECGLQLCRSSQAEERSSEGSGSGKDCEEMKCRERTTQGYRFNRQSAAEAKKKSAAARPMSRLAYKMGCGLAYSDGVQRAGKPKRSSRDEKGGAQGA